MNRPLVRWTLGAAGLAAVGWGAWLVLTGGRATDVRSVVLWAGIVLVAHDAVLAPLVVLAGWLASRRLPGPARAPVQVGTLVAASVTLVSAPLWLGRLVRGAPTANPSADPLDYPRNVLGVLALVVVLTAAAVVVATLQARRATKSRPPRRQRSSSR